MDDIIINGRITIPSSAVSFRYTRSGGKGGQNVNKVSTRVELLLDASKIRASERLLLLIMSRMQNKLDSEGLLRIVSQESRSQWQNKQSAVEKLTVLIEAASKQDPYRVATKPSRSSKIVRVESKKKAGVKKQLRRKRFDQSHDQ
ncbi:MAG: alternative ribosome rescue aminoacyl-tRNA hydrolase ArfB [Bacteroidota bacterium]